MHRQHARIAENLAILEGRWTGLILLCLMEGELRYGALRSNIPEITDRVLSKRLGELESNGLIYRRTIAARPPEVWYGITRRAEGLGGVFSALAGWKPSRKRGK